MNIREKGKKIKEYIKLEKMFLQQSEFRSVHPELIALWKHKFRQMIRYSSERTFAIAEEFLKVSLEKVHAGEWEQVNENDPVLVCAVKNDLEKIKKFIPYYKELGIRQFVVIDNDSSDGTFEFLCEHKEITVYRCTHSFTADRKIAWIDRVIAEIGDDRWYLMVDSDEFVTYLGVNEHKIDEFVRRNRELGRERIGSFMLDMYPKEALFESTGETDFMENYCYFDKDTYEVMQARNGLRIKGGPRFRKFGTTMKLSKYCLFYFGRDDIVPSAHIHIPFEKSLNAPVSIAIRHYKFLNHSDFDKVVEAVQTGMHSEDSKEYKTYLKGINGNEKLTLFDEAHSLEFSEENLRQIKFLTDVFEK